MNLRRPPADARPVPTEIRLAHEEPTAFSHEHARLYTALETAAQLAEMAGHEWLAKGLRGDRHAIDLELQSGFCNKARAAGRIEGDTTPVEPSE